MASANITFAVHMPTDETRAAHAALVPVYVRAEGDAWTLADTATDETLSTHDTARQALIAATKRDDVQALGKSANLRQDGEPIGVWRWLDASAEEDESIDGSRITAPSLWEMASSLNGRKSAIPINGGGAPRAGLGDSLPHGDAYTGGDHLANGFAHLAFPVIDHTGRTHMFLRSELLPEVAAEVDLGRLAYGSIRFGFAEADPDDDYAIKGAVLISHALTNDPAVTTLTAGSERRRGNEPVNVACRTRRSDSMVKPKTSKTSQRGPVADVLAKIAAMLGIPLESIDDNPWAVSDAVYTLQNAAKVEEVLAAVDATPEPAEGEAAAEARARAVLRSLRAVAGREVEDLEPDEASDALEALVGLGRDVLGKPDAAPEEVVAELVARKDEIAEALSEEPATEPGESEEEREEGDEDEPTEPPPDEDEEKQRAARASAELASAELALAALRARAEAAAVEAGKLATELTAERDKTKRYETREWLDAEIAKRGLSVPTKQRDRYLDLAIGKGRDVVGEILDARNAPPGSNPLDSEPTHVAPVPVSQRDAIAACEDEAAKVERARDPKVAAHVIYGRAQRIAEQKWPELFNQAPRAASAG